MEVCGRGLGAGAVFRRSRVRLLGCVCLLAFRDWIVGVFRVTPGLLRGALAGPTCGGLQTKSEARGSVLNSPGSDC